ncbi:unnamed protein product, partial [marine sediment metagenome]
MMQPMRKNEFTISSEVILGPVVGPLLFQHGVWQHYGSPQLPARVRPMRYVSRSAHTAQYHVPAAAWTPTYGGFLVVARLPDGRASRVAGIWRDPDIARKVWAYNNEKKRGGLLLQSINDTWYAIVRFTNWPKKKKRKAQSVGVHASPRRSDSH